MKNRKGQTGGLITGLVFGVASLVIAAIIAFVIVSTLDDAELLTSGRTTADTLRERGFINETGYPLANFDSDTTTDISIIGAQNVSNLVNANETILAANFTLNTGNGVVTNATTTTYSAVEFNYSVTSESLEESSTDSLRANYSEGIDNISDNIPVVLLIAAVVLILGVLAVLVGVWQRMRMGGGTSL